MRRQHRPKDQRDNGIANFIWCGFRYAHMNARAQGRALDAGHQSDADDHSETIRPVHKLSKYVLVLLPFAQCQVNCPHRNETKRIGMEWNGIGTASPPPGAMMSEKLTCM
ncbi:PREDICTED: uncharacterized protein LOC108618690 [Drosophila arizonae]|uniref:Uncharacterized protein LOC108618690 n=1 Tax=Drosophila arizonae TaxID=7263 RepID=A0ABM1PSV0_DROAR|nr:PREDICTED: uncharacterized protein LOC108618690 [Drosophila arizonae]